MKKIVLPGYDIFQLPSSELSESGKKKLNILVDRVKKISNKSYIVITTNNTPFIENIPGRFENHDLGLLRANLI